jgi:hypothetical protein
MSGIDGSHLGFKAFHFGFHLIVVLGFKHGISPNTEHAARLAYHRI